MLNSANSCFLHFVLYHPNVSKISQGYNNSTKLIGWLNLGLTVLFVMVKIWLI